MENKQETWEQIKKFYKEKFDIEPELADLMADYDILKLCASGSSNSTIAKFLNLEPYDVRYIIDKHLGFMGWADDLQCNPLKVYNDLQVKNLVNFTDALGQQYITYDIELAFRVAELTSGLERMLDEKWI